MSVLERALALLEERSPRSPHELSEAIDCPPLEIYAALGPATWAVERCAPEAGHVWWWRLTAHEVALRRAAAAAEAKALARRSLP